MDDIKINKRLLEEIKEYARLNDIEDFDKFINKVLEKGMSSIKFGSLPMSVVKETKPIKPKTKGVVKKTTKKETSTKVDNEIIFTV